MALYADESEAGVRPPVSCFYVSRLSHLPTYVETPRPPTHRDIKSQPPGRGGPRGLASMRTLITFSFNARLAFNTPGLGITLREREFLWSSVIYHQFYIFVLERVL